MQYTAEQLRFLQTEFKRLSTAELTKVFNEKYGTRQSEKAIHATLTRNGFLSGRRGADILKGKYKLVTQEQAEWIAEKYKTLTRKQLTDEFNRVHGTDISYKQMVTFVKNHRIKSGRDGHFPKGQIPWNTGTVGVMKPNATSFKKGDMPLNYRPVGSERVNVDGYIEIKVADPNVWDLKHRVIWQQHNGPLQAGENVVMIDGDRTNTNIENLRKVTDAELGVMNIKYQFSRQPRHIRDSVVLLSKLDVKIKDLNKNRRA